MRLKRCLNETINKGNDFISNRTKFTESILRQDPFYAVFTFLRVVFMDLFWKCLYSLTYSINLKVLLSYCRVDYIKNDKIIKIEWLEVNANENEKFVADAGLGKNSASIFCSLMMWLIEKWKQMKLI